MPPLGAHLSVAGGLWQAPHAAGRLRCGAVQIFLRAPGRWYAPALAVAHIERFREACREAHLEGACFAHAPYLLNLASSDAALRARSLDTLTDELRRAGALGLAGVVLHPGSAGAGDRRRAEACCRAAIAEAVERAGSGARLLLEGTAGAGGQLGRSPVELAGLVAPEVRGRVGLCLDTAHLWGAGYDLSGDGLDQVLDEVAACWESATLDLLHINDTTVPLGSRRDRHAPPGEGAIGEAFYRRLLGEERLAATPMVMEIPPGEGNRLIKTALARLRRWPT